MNTLDLKSISLPKEKDRERIQYDNRGSVRVLG